jgi:hypothetical protein
MNIRSLLLGPEIVLHFAEHLTENHATFQGTIEK